MNHFQPDDPPEGWRRLFDHELIPPVHAYRQFDAAKWVVCRGYETSTPVRPSDVPRWREYAVPPVQPNGRTEPADPWEAAVQAQIKLKQKEQDEPRD